MGLGRSDRKYITYWTFLCVVSMLFYSEYVFIKRKKMEKENASTDAFVFYQTEDIAVQE